MIISLPKKSYYFNDSKDNSSLDIDYSNIEQLSNGDNGFVMESGDSLTTIGDKMQLVNVTSAIYLDPNTQEISSLYNQSKFIDFYKMINNIYKKGAIDKDTSLSSNINEGYMKKLEDQWSNYLPDQFELVEDRLVEEYNGYLIYIVSSDNEKALEVIKDCVAK